MKKQILLAGLLVWPFLGTTPAWAVCDGFSCLTGGVSSIFGSAVSNVGSILLAPTTQTNPTSHPGATTGTTPSIGTLFNGFQNPLINMNTSSPNSPGSIVNITGRNTASGVQFSNGTITLTGSGSGIQGGPSPVVGPSLSSGATSSIGGIGGGITVGDVQGLDLETALQLVQSQRATLLETQLKDQILGVQARNDQIAQLNTLISDIRTLPFKNSSSPDPLPNLVDRIYQYAPSLVPAKFMPDTAANRAAFQAQLSSDPAFQLSSIESLKGQIDSLNSSQQMDMLKLQSLTNNRNEAFDLMTNFIKKMADSRSSILGNMR